LDKSGFVLLINSLINKVKSIGNSVMRDFEHSIDGFFNGLWLA